MFRDSECEGRDLERTARSGRLKRPSGEIKWTVRVYVTSDRFEARLPCLRSVSSSIRRMPYLAYSLETEASRGRPAIVRSASFWNIPAILRTLAYELPHKERQYVRTGSNGARFWLSRSSAPPELLSREREEIAARHFPDMGFEVWTPFHVFVKYETQEFDRRLESDLFGDHFAC